MPTYSIEVIETRHLSYEVTADTEGDAVDLLKSITGFSSSASPNVKLCDDFIEDYSVDIDHISEV